MLESLKSRKFILAIFVQIILTALILLDKLAGGEFITGTIAVSGAYMTANVITASNANRLS